MVTRKVGVRRIFTKKILVLFLLIIIPLRDVNGMMGFPIVATEDSEDNNDNKFCFMPQNTVSLRLADMSSLTQKMMIILNCPVIFMM